MTLERIERGDLDPSFIITHRIRLEETPVTYRTLLINTIRISR